MVSALHVAAQKLIRELGARGITVLVRGDRIEVSPRSRLIVDDRERIRRLKTALIACLSPCESHFDPGLGGWLREPLADRPGWERASCRRCGKFIGFNPIHQTDGGAGIVQKTVLRSAGGDGGYGGYESGHLRPGF